MAEPSDQAFGISGTWTGILLTGAASDVNQPPSVKLALNQQTADTGVEYIGNLEMGNGHVAIDGVSHDRRRPAPSGSLSLFQQNNPLPLRRMYPIIPQAI